MKLYKIQFNTKYYDPEFESFSDIIVAQNPEQIRKGYSELFNENTDLYCRELLISEISRVLGVDHNYYNVNLSLVETKRDYKTWHELRKELKSL